MLGATHIFLFYHEYPVVVLNVVYNEIPFKKESESLLNNMWDK